MKLLKFTCVTNYFGAATAFMFYSDILRGFSHAVICSKYKVAVAATEYANLYVS